MRALNAASRCKGVTLIELVLVIVLLSILGSVAVSSFSSTADMTLRPQASLLVQNLRHLQALAVHQGKTLTMDAVSSGYSAKEATVTITDPAKGDPFLVTLENGVSLVAAASIDFDEMGRPETTGTGTLINIAKDFVLIGSANTITVSVTPVTGFITITP